MDVSPFEVAIVGGGATGCASAFALKTAGIERVCVIEPDPTYAKAATPVATGGCRRLFALPENNRMSQYSIDFFKDFSRRVAVDGHAPEVQWKELGYLFVVGPGHEKVLEENYRVQQGLGVKVELLDRAEIARRYPWMRCDDLALGALSPEDGWLDPSSVLQGLRKKAQAMGTVFLRDRVGIDVPVTPMRRFEHYVELARELPQMPLIKDPERLIIRPEGKGYSVGLVRSNEPRGFNFDVEPGWFQDVVWPACASRVPEFEELKLKREWSGLYDECELDGNMILGACAGGPENFYIACGFSGMG